MVFQSIHALCWSLFTSTYDTNYKGKFEDPVMQFFLSYILRSSGQVLPPGNITPILAKLQYVMRLTYFFECNTQSKLTNEPMMK